MAPSKGNHAKIRKACKAMKTYGISAAKVRSELKRLLKLYENNWMYIEEDDYKVLLDAVLEPDGPKTMEIVKHDLKLLDEPEDEEDEEEQEETIPLKRKRLLRSEVTSSSIYASEIRDDNRPAPAGYLCENGEKLLALEYNNMDSEANMNEDENENENTNENENEDVPPSPSISEIDIASSFNGEVKLTFSICKPPPSFRIPSLDAVIKHVDDIYREKFGTEFSLSQLLKDVCQSFMEQGDASDHVGNKIPSFDNLKQPEKQGGPTNDPIKIRRFVDSSEFDHCLSGKKLRKQQMVGVDELSGSSSLTIFSKEQSTVELCMEQADASDHAGNKIPSFDIFKEPEKQGGPTDDPIKIPIYVVSSEFDYCGKMLRKQQMVGIDELSGSSSLTIFQNEQSMVDHQGNVSDHAGNKIPSFDNFKEPEKQGGPTDDPMQIPRFVVSSEFDHCFNEKLLRKQKMDGIDELSCSSSLTIFQNEQLTVDLCMEEGNASNHDGNKIPYFDNFKEPEKQGGPTDDPMQITRFVVSSDFSHCFSEKLRKQQMVGMDELSCSGSLTVFQNEQSTIDLCSKHYFVADITRGLEKQEISLVNEIDNEKLPTFTYIQTNVNYKAANVKFMLARISDENSCPNCFGDCLSPEVPCACAVETGGEFAYTTKGFVDDKFLKNCIDISLKPTKKDYFYCDNCPLERMKKRKTNQSQSGSCKGHLVRKFIKECWYKCGCNFNCGNRVIQRGIQAKLQVFMTPEGKGWGLRTLEDLPKGTFVCEYVGEIVTNSELLERNEQNQNEEHTYPVLLDADWSSEGFLKDEEALCLDATSFGNAARFINHRCVDANLVEIPVEVESPDHHYYHLAFFTTREVKSMEELTWDYGIDFNDGNHPVKAFPCKCGSKSCKAFKRYKRIRHGW